MGESWKKLNTSNLCVFVVNCLFEIEIDQLIVHDLLSYNSLFVGKLYKDKSLALLTRDLIFFTTDLQTVNYYTSNHCQS